MGKTPLSMLGYFIDADELEKPRRITLAALGATAAAAVTAGIVKAIRKQSCEIMNKL